MSPPTITGAAHSLVAQSIRKGPPSSMPFSFNDETTLFLFNLGAMTAATFLGVMMAGKVLRRIWKGRRLDGITSPVTIYRAILFCAAMGLTLRSGAAAMELWGWNPHDPVMVARVLMAKRWIDPVALLFGITWMGFAVLGEPGVEAQLRKTPLPVDMWTRWPALARAGGVVALSFIAALAAISFR